MEHYVAISRPMVQLIYIWCNMVHHIGIGITAAATPVRWHDAVKLASVCAQVDRGRGPFNETDTFSDCSIVRPHSAMSRPAVVIFD